MSRHQAPAGQVWAHVGQAFRESHFDVVVIGAGRMGTAAAFYLRQLCPQRSLLLVEEGGLPNEEGATLLAPGVWSTLGLPADKWPAAQWTRTQLTEFFHELPVESRPLIEWQTQATPDSVPSGPLWTEFPEVAALFDAEAWPEARIDRQALCYRPGSLALSAGQRAVKAGANLLLNTRAAPLPGGVRLERLSVTNTHQIVTHETHTVHAGTVVVAAGASGPALAEYSLGQHCPHGRAYVQYPRLGWPSREGTPVLRAAGLLLRPQAGAFTLSHAPGQRDPHGYQPTAGQLTGVPTGLRRELLEDLVALMDRVPALASDRLELGRSLSDVPGAWLSLPSGGGWPMWETLGGGVYLLLGGPHADSLGLSVAQGLARQVAGAS